MYVRKFSASGQGFIKIQKSVLELLKKYFWEGMYNTMKNHREIIKFVELLTDY